jgi:nucleotide-binding universal stress UspA family protein
MVTRIVVGVDGSEESRKALAWAVEEARRWNAPLRVVHAWRPPRASVFDAPAAVRPELEQALRDVGEQVVDDSLTAVLSGAETGVEIERLVVPEPPVEALLAAVRDADLLVVSSRGRGGFAGLLLGSVSQQVAHHAPCPVVVVRALEEGAA